MTDPQWEKLLKTIHGEAQHPLPVGFIIDCPWLPNWHGIQILDYFSNDALWLEANLKALRAFPDVLFLPGFWSEYGMCTEPSAFGARCTFPVNEFPHAHRIIRSSADIDDLVAPDPRTDGLLPLVLRACEKFTRLSPEAQAALVAYAEEQKLFHLPALG